ncbi:MAG: chromosome segregation protein SMC [Euryarchaeota archaeon]|nr:MAG: Chromosome partition protein Smc [ANME-2 cluster archaeon]MEA1866081.1 chromosome segregation protein SMC [Euryarchaeota archaeon]
MHIKEIEFENFKSFGKKVKIPLFNDFTTISGPNGSGKSNIVDGIIFVLGLSGSRTMRAEKLTDLIFNGNGTRKELDSALVTIRFDNSDRFFPSEGDTIEIARRIRQTRSGYYSYYYFNDRACTLSEVHAHLARAGIRPEGCNVVMQGDVTRITEMTPFERRKLIDEIAGVAEFDEKKERAHNELDTVREKIERIEIILSEVTQQRRKLKRERDQAMKYQSLKDERERYEAFTILAKLKNALKEEQSISKEIASKQETEIGLQSDLNEKEEELSGIESALRDLNEKIMRKGEHEQIEIKKEIEQIRGEISRLVNSIELLEHEIKDVRKERERLFMDVDSSGNLLAECEEKINDERLRKESVLAEIEANDSELMLIRSRIDEVDAKYAETRDRLDAEKKNVELAKSTRNEDMREQDRLLDAIRRKSTEEQELHADIEDAEKSIASVDDDLKSLQSEIDCCTKGIETQVTDRNDLESSRSELRPELDGIEKHLNDIYQKYVKTEARVKAAEDLRYPHAVKTVLDAKKAKELPGVYGTVASLGRVEQEHAVPLEVAAGARMQNVVVESDETASHAINLLKRKSAGRATFLPLNKLRSDFSYKSLPEMTGVIDYAINLIDFDSKFEKAFRYVFRDMVVVDTLGTARKLIGDYNMVTSSGELVTKAGAMTGGSTSNRGSHFAAMEQEKLVKLAEQIAEYDSRKKNLADRIDSVEGHISSINIEINELEKKIAKKQLQTEEVAGRSDRLTVSIQKKQETLRDIKAERETMRTQMEEIESKIASETEQIRELMKSVSKLESELGDSEIPVLNSQSDRITSEINRLRDRVRDIETDIKSMILEKDNTKTKLETDKNRIKELEHRKTEHQSKITEFRDDILDCEEKLKEKSDRENELDCELSALQEERATVQKRLDTMSRSLSSLQKRLDQARWDSQALIATQDALKDQITALRSEIVESGIDESQDVPTEEEVRTRIQSIDSAMVRLEPINMRAIEEYEAVELRMSTLKTRKDTLSDEREGIIGRIEKYEFLKKQTFFDSFDVINGYFKSIFAELSGGHGELILENPEDPFTGGMTIRAQPADKTLQRLEAMSGGEKSLTALAFIFAIQQHRPAPFYAFDEIDMFLDGANVERIASRIEKSAKSAQFIVVSLRKPMIQAASHTIGVAMQENDISSVTGVQLN